MDPDPDPGGPKTCGSGGFGSATRVFRIKIAAVGFLKRVTVLKEFSELVSYFIKAGKQF
jgi:hypothetical protein